MQKDDAMKQFEQEREKRIHEYCNNKPLLLAAKRFFQETQKAKYEYNFSWLGRPIIQYPQDIIAMQEIMWEVKPDLMIETGIAHGGSTIFYASVLHAIGKGSIISIDIDIRRHNLAMIKKSPVYKRVILIEDSSTSSRTMAAIHRLARNKKKILVALDSLHSHDHVLQELELYAPLVSKGSYLVVFDTFIENMPPHSYPNRSWDKGSNPKTAVIEFLKKNPNFIVDESISQKLLISSCPGGYLKKIA